MNLDSSFDFHTFSEREDLATKATSLRTALPEFMGHDAVDDLYWRRLCDEFANFQFSLSREGEVVAAGYTVPVRFGLDNLPDGGWDAALSGAFEEGSGSEGSGSEAFVALCALLAIVSPEARGSGVSKNLLGAMKEISYRHGFDRLLAPVRPSLKHLYPLTPMENYIKWRRDDGLLFDPWMRVHERLGAKVIKVAPESMKINGSISEWESWTKLHFPESGSYVVEGALVPVEMDTDSDIGTYTEPNVWMVHETR